MEYMRTGYKALSGKPESKRSLVRPRNRWKYISIYLQVIGWEDLN
jgi:hypothetical protein